ncbi:MAG: response regulator transcription factor [Candidatus Omnitrophica bacterium]|nr:response regulator transcription factor [Candidatus Omnitrophota bacterium]
MAKEKILMIEDEKNIVELVKYNLEEQGYSVAAEMRGDQGLQRAIKEIPDLILLDLMLPGMNGIDICKTLKNNEKTSHVPVIMLTAKSEELDKVLGLEIGADDYMTKPFSPRELVARIKAVLRRGQERQTDTVLKAGTLEVDDSRHVVKLKNKVVELTAKEYDLLKALMEVKGRVVTREHLLDHVWGYDQSLNIETRTVDMHIGQLRKKLKNEAERIVTVKNVGYRFEIDE